MAIYILYYIKDKNYFLIPRGRHYSKSISMAETVVIYNIYIYVHDIFRCWRNIFGSINSFDSSFELGTLDIFIFLIINNCNLIDQRNITLTEN